MMRKTFSMKTDAAVTDRKWQVVDVAGMTLGRACTQIAHVLRGKHKPTLPRTSTRATSWWSSTPPRSR